MSSSSTLWCSQVATYQKSVSFSLCLFLYSSEELCTIWLSLACFGSEPSYRFWITGYFCLWTRIRWNCEWSELKLFAHWTDNWYVIKKKHGPQTWATCADSNWMQNCPSPLCSIFLKDLSYLTMNHNTLHGKGLFSSHSSYLYCCRHISFLCT